MAGGQSATLKKCLLAAPRSGGDLAYVQGTSQGVEFDQCIRDFANEGITPLGGTGLMRVTEAGLEGGAGGWATVLNVQSLFIPRTGPLSLAAGTVVPAPDYQLPGWNTGASSNIEVTTSVDGLNWIGGIAAAPEGAIIGLTNISGGGQAINIIDQSLGGSIFLAQPSIVIAFRATAWFKRENGFWILLHAAGQYYNSGGCGLPAGSRVSKTNGTNTPIVAYAWPKGAGTVPALGWVVDIAAESGGAGVDVGFWLGASMAWDGLNNPLGILKKGDVRGTGGGNVPPFGWDISVADDASNHNLMFTGDNAHTVIVRVVARPISPPF